MGETCFTSVLDLIKACMHALLENDIETHGISQDMYISRRFFKMFFYAQVDHRASVKLWAFWRNLQKDKKNCQLYLYFIHSSHVRTRCTYWVTEHWDWIDNTGPPSYLLCLFCSQFCLYMSVSLTKSSILRACHQKKMLSAVKMQVLLRERKLTFYLCVITLGYMQLNWF